MDAIDMAILVEGHLDDFVQQARERVVNHAPLRWPGHYLSVIARGTLEDSGLPVNEQVEYILDTDPAILDAVYKPRYSVLATCDCHGITILKDLRLRSDAQFNEEFRQFCLEHYGALFPLVMRA